MLFSCKGWDQIAPRFSAPTNPFPGSSAFLAGWKLPVEVGSTFLFKPGGSGTFPWAGPQQSFHFRAPLNGPGLLCPLKLPFVSLSGKCFQVAPGKPQVLPSPSPLTSM